MRTERGFQVRVVAALAFGGVTLLWFLLGFGLPLIWRPLHERALWGDAFGLVGALFSGLAFAGVLVALYFQSKGLQLERDVVAKQLASIESQRTEAAFFSLLEMHRATVRDMTYGKFSGRPALQQMGREMHQILRSIGDPSSPLGAAQHAYGEFHDSWFPYLGHYFRLVGETLRFLGEMDDRARALTYGRLLRAQLSSDELLLLIVWMMSGDVHERDEDIAMWAEEFGIFRGLHFRAIDENYQWIKSAWHEIAESLGSDKSSFRASGRYE